MKLRRYTYIIIDGNNYKATYDQNTANKAKENGKTVLAVCGEYADVQDLAYDEARHNQIEVNFYNVDDMEQYAKRYGNEHAPELYEEWLKNKVLEHKKEVKKYNDILKDVFDFYDFETDYDY